VHRAKRIASSLTVVSFATLMWACGGSEPAHNNAPAPATNKATNAPASNAAASNANATNAAAPTAAASMTIPDNVKPIYTAKCAGCHGADAKGGPAAPDIFKVKDKHTADEWVSYLKNPKIWEKDNKMPAVKGTDDELKKVGDWLATATGSAPAAAK
jgi:mono/diheme cytochrome c family protein